MSNRKLETATAGRYGAPRFPSKLALFQNLYDTRRHKSHPITPDRLRHLCEDLKLISIKEEDVGFNPEFTTDDGSRWMTVGFRYVSGKRYLIAFPLDEDPKHRDCTVSAQHVALYCNEEDVSDVELDHVAQAAYAIFHTFRH